MEIRKAIKDLVLKTLNDNGGQNVKLTTVLLPYDSNRTDIRGVLFALEGDGLIKIDKDFNRLSTKYGGRYDTLGSITLIARLTPKGESYYKEHYGMKEESIPTFKIDIGHVQSISHSTINAPVNQSSDSSEKHTVKNVTKSETSSVKQIVFSVIGGLILALILYYIFGIS